MADTSLLLDVIMNTPQRCAQDAALGQAGSRHDVVLELVLALVWITDPGCCAAHWRGPDAAPDSLHVCWAGHKGS